MTVGVFSLQKKYDLGSNHRNCTQTHQDMTYDIRPFSENINENETNKNILSNKTNLLHKSKLS